MSVHTDTPSVHDFKTFLALVWTIYIIRFIYTVIRSRTKDSHYELEIGSKF